MDDESRRYALDVSEDFFKLAVESLRLHSLETRRFQTLSGLINARATGDRPIGAARLELLKEHLSLIRSKGDIHITFKITQTSADNLAEAKARLARQIGGNMTVADALSLLLFDYIVERRAAQVVKSMGLEDGVGREPITEKCIISVEENVYPLR